MNPSILRSIVMEGIVEVGGGKELGRERGN